jgi:hypothetical protein
MKVESQLKAQREAAKKEQERAKLKERVAKEHALGSSFLSYLSV